MTEKRYIVQQHIGCEKCKHAVENADKQKNVQLLLAQSVGRKVGTPSDFFKELCDMLVYVNIPLKKINNPKLKNFLECHIGRSILDESTLRKNYIPVCYNETMARIRDNVRGKKIFVSIDESIDANVILGTLELDGSGKIFLLTSEIV